MSKKLPVELLDHLKSKVIAITVLTDEFSAIIAALRSSGYAPSVVIRLAEKDGDSVSRLEVLDDGVWETGSLSISEEDFNRLIEGD